MMKWESILIREKKMGEVSDVERHNGVLNTFDEIMEYIEPISKLVAMDVNFLVGDNEDSIKLSELRNLLILPVAFKGYTKS